MREILFRGKQSDNGKWAEGSLAFFFDNPKNSMIMPRCFFGTRHFGEEDEKGNLILEDEVALGGFLDVISETVGQFTGILDKNGKKIFEGDILKCISPNDGSEFISDFIATLSNGITFKNSDLNWDMTLFEYEWMEVEIIGNIHDNPELLCK